VGVPAALAWGMEGLHSEDQSFLGVAGRSAALASSRTTHRSKIARIILIATRKPNRTPDYLFILPDGRHRVTSQEGSIAAVLDAGTSVPGPGASGPSLASDDCPKLFFLTYA
jgi:hypothetical protein